MNDYDPYWICKGSQQRPHPEEEVERDERCPTCGQYQPSETTKSSSSLPLGKIVGGIALLALLGSVGGLVFSKFNSSEISTPTSTPTPAPIPVPTPTPVPPTIPTTYSWEPERFTKGERTLFPGKPNENRDLGIEAFQKSNYDDAVKFFEQAVDENRNDPEVLILYNNALARQQNVLQQNNPLTLAAVVPVQGNQDFAEHMLRGIAMAQNQFNASREANEQLLEIVIANDGNLPDKAKKVAKELVNDKSVLGVIGHNSSGASEAGLELYEGADLAIISPTSTSTSLESDVFFRTVPSDEAAGMKLAQYLNDELKLTKVVIFYNPNSSYSNSINNAFIENFSGTVVNKIDISDPQLNIKNQLYASVLEKNAQAALLFPNTLLIGNAIRIAKANANLKEDRIKLFGGDALYSSQTLIAGGEAVEDLILAVPWAVDYSESKEFKKIGKRWGGALNWRTAMSYDATQAFIAALSNTPNPDRTSIIEELKKIKLSDAKTSGDKLKFTSGEREGEPVLVKATRNAKNLPQGSEYGFALVK